MRVEWQGESWCGYTSDESNGQVIGGRGPCSFGVCSFLIMQVRIECRGSWRPHEAVEARKRRRQATAPACGNYQHSELCRIAALWEQWRNMMLLSGVFAGTITIVPDRATVCLPGNVHLVNTVTSPGGCAVSQWRKAYGKLYFLARHAEVWLSCEHLLMVRGDVVAA